MNFPVSIQEQLEKSLCDGIEVQELKRLLSQLNDEDVIHVLNHADDNGVYFNGVSVERTLQDRLENVTFQQNDKDVFISPEDREEALETLVQEAKDAEAQAIIDGGPESILNFLVDTFVSDEEIIFQVKRVLKENFDGSKR